MCDSGESRIPEFEISLFTRHGMTFCILHTTYLLDIPCAIISHKNNADMDCQRVCGEASSVSID